MHSIECIPLLLIPTPHGLPPHNEGGSGRGFLSYSARRVKRLKSVTVKSLSMPLRY